MEKVKAKKRKLRIPLPKQTSKVKGSAKVFNRKKETYAQNIMRIMGWSE